MATRGLLILVLLLAQEGRRESGKYTLSVAGKETGAEEYRLEEFDDGKIVLFAKAKFELDLAGTRRSYLTDTVLTMDKTYAPSLYAGFRKAGREQDQVKIEWEKGVATTPKRQIKTSARFLLDTTVIAHLIPILRGADPAKKKIRLFNPTALTDFEGSVEDRGEALLRGKESTLKVREIQVNLGYISYTAHVDEKKRLIRAWSAVNNSLAELEGFEGFVPESVAPEGIEETDVAFQNGPVKLSGTLTRPRGAQVNPAVLIVSDTGPQDRQGNLVKGRGGAEEFAWPGADAGLQRSIAQSLAGAGLMVLRYDDRGCGQSEGDFGKARFSDLVADAAAGVAYLRSRSDAGPVGIVGHGEGALAACVLAAKDGAIKGVVLLAPPPVPLDEILLLRAERALREQGTRDEAMKDMLAQQRKQFDAIRASKEDYLEIDERRTFVGWMRERITVDPRLALAKVRVPALLCAGGKDRELTPAQIEALRLARPGLETRTFEGLDHAFAGPEGRVDPGFLQVLADRVPPLLK
ncbi:MAG TPA: alpha/beta fold hydrolase [Planctomycetota bacterium]|nr:alpha/beta fold hydrolase [Planctomycetota bacterium]